MLKEPFQLGSLTLSSNIFCAPLAGCSDLPFRRMTTRFRPGLVYCEMVKMDALVRADANTYRLLDYEADMHPIGAQLCGSKPSIAGQAAKIIEELGFDVIDLNCGCPVDKVTKDGSGSGMLKNPELIGDVIANIRAAVSIPVTVKVRIGWDKESINVVEVGKVAKAAGCAAICVHGRTRAQGYKGPAEWEYIRACKEAVGEMLVIGNGDLFTPKAVRQMFVETGCDAVLIARGTMGQPWIIEDVLSSLRGEGLALRSGADYKNALLEHFEHVIAYSSERQALLDLRRIGCWYLRQARGAGPLREALNRSQSTAQALSLMEQFAWDEMQLEAAPSTEETC